MHTCLTPREIELYAAEITEEFRRLMESRQVAVQRKARQWLLLRRCFNALFDIRCADFRPGERKAAEYRRAVKEKLELYYQNYYRLNNSAGRKPPLRFKFWLTSEKNRKELFGDSDYPCSDGYMLLVIPADPALRTEQQTRDAIVCAADDAAQAAYEAFLSLPELNLDLLTAAYDPQGTAYAHVLKILERHAKHRHRLSYPSTRPWLREVDVKSVTPGEAVVRTVELWNLHWTSQDSSVYVWWYRGRDEQTYTLARHGDRWRVREMRAHRTPRV